MKNNRKAGGRNQNQSDDLCNVHGRRRIIIRWGPRGVSRGGEDRSHQGGKDGNYKRHTEGQVPLESRTIRVFDSLETTRGFRVLADFSSPDTRR